jgi:hypothetical protein
MFNGFGEAHSARPISVREHGPLRIFDNVASEAYFQIVYLFQSQISVGDTNTYFESEGTKYSLHPKYKINVLAFFKKTYI